MKSNCFIRLGSLVLLLSSLYSSTVLAQSPAQAIERLQAKQLQLRADEDALRAKSQSISSAMAKTEQSDIPGKAAYDEAVASFEKASEQYENEPSTTNKSRVHNAEFKLHLAERKYRSGNVELQKLEEQQDDVETQLITVRRSLDDIDEQIPQLRQRTAEQRARQGSGRYPSP
ncbi:MAG: chromosome segregation ATPase [Bermanella sp.]|jgi:chromosome segregation ATPase